MQRDQTFTDVVTKKFTSVTSMNIANQTLGAANMVCNLTLGHASIDKLANNGFPIHDITISHMRYKSKRQSGSDLYHTNNMSIGSNIRRRRKELGWNQKQLAGKSGLSQTTISDIERGRNDSSTGLHDIAKAMMISVEQLIKGNWSGSMESLIPKPSIDAHAEGSIINVTTTLLHQVPLISWVKAGEFCEAIDLLQPGDCERMIDTKYAKRRHTYALRVIGDSMEPRFPEGTILIVEPDMALEHGHFVIAKMGNEVTFKQAKLDGTQWWLCPLNERYLPIKVTEDIHICGIAVYAQWEDKLV